METLFGSIIWVHSKYGDFFGPLVKKVTFFAVSWAFVSFSWKKCFFSSFPWKKWYFSSFPAKSDFFCVFMSNWVIRTKKGHFFGSGSKFTRKYCGILKSLPESIAGFWKVYQKVLEDSEKFTRKYWRILKSLPESIAGFWKVYQKVLEDSEKFTRKYWRILRSLPESIGGFWEVYEKTDIFGFSAIHYRIV